MASRDSNNAAGPELQSVQIQEIGLQTSITESPSSGPNSSCNVVYSSPLALSSLPYQTVRHIPVANTIMRTTAKPQVLVKRDSVSDADTWQKDSALTLSHKYNCEDQQQTEAVYIEVVENDVEHTNVEHTNVEHTNTNTDDTQLQTSGAVADKGQFCEVNVHDVHKPYIIEISQEQEATLKLEECVIQREGETEQEMPGPGLIASFQPQQTYTAYQSTQDTLDPIPQTAPPDNTARHHTDVHHPTDITIQLKHHPQHMEGAPTILTSATAGPSEDIASGQSELYRQLHSLFRGGQLASLLQPLSAQGTPLVISPQPCVTRTTSQTAVSRPQPHSCVKDKFKCVLSSVVSSSAVPAVGSPAVPLYAPVTQADLSVATAQPLLVSSLPSDNTPPTSVINSAMMQILSPLLTESTTAVTTNSASACQELTQLQGIADCGAQLYQSRPPDTQEPGLIDNNIIQQKTQPGLQSSTPIQCVELFVQHQGSVVEAGSEGACGIIEVININGSPELLTETAIYCVECNKRYPKGCLQHDSSQYVHVPDRPIESRARMTVPHCLYLSNRQNSVNTGVFCKEDLAKGTSFGPLEGQLLTKDRLDDEVDYIHIWEIFCNGQPLAVLDCRSEDTSNWLRFVKRANTDQDQNLVVCQQSSLLFFYTTRPIKANEELLFWYASDYAKVIEMPCSPSGHQKCAKCPKHFLTKQDLKRHMTQVHPEHNRARKYNCPECKKAFQTRTKVEIHMSTHTGVKPFACSHCAKCFTDKSNLKKHMLIHKNEKGFVCPECNKSFRQRTHLVSHMAIHYEEKRFSCTYCGKKFARHSDLTQHTYMHTKGAHNFMCTECGKDFYRKQNLKRHIIIHASDRVKVPCDRCTKEFPSKYHLKRHSLTCKGLKLPLPQISSETGAELGLSIAKKRIQKRDNQLKKRKVSQT